MPLTTPTVGCVRGVMKHPAAPCPARYKHTTCGVVVEASLAGRRAGLQLWACGVFPGTKAAPSAGHGQRCASRPSSRHCAADHMRRPWHHAEMLHMREPFGNSGIFGFLFFRLGFPALTFHHPKSTDDSFRDLSTYPQTRLGATSWAMRLITFLPASRSAER